LRERIARASLDALLITFPHDIRYLSGFCGEDAWALVTPRDVYVLSDRRFEQELAALDGAIRPIIRRKSLAEELARPVRSRRLKTLGVQSEHLTLAQRRLLRRHVPGVRLRDTSGWLLEQRAVKDAAEVALIERAVAVQEEALRRTLDEVRPGCTEREVTGVLESWLWKLGADGPGFNTIVGAGANSSICHYAPGAARVLARQPLLIDWGALVDGYHSDMTRVVFYGGVSREFRTVYNLVRAAHDAAVEIMAPGVPLKEVDAAARRVIERGGYGPQFSHSLGHGIGLVIHEEPRLAATSQGELRPGQVVTVEPGIYLPGTGGVRIENDVLITDTGCRMLCALPTGLDWAVR
jgi:Xaa-Pro aminopeptidase